MKDTMNLIQGLFFRLYKAVRGASIECGGNRELSSGFLSNGVRRNAFRFSVSRPGLLLEVGCGEGILLSQLSKGRSGLLFGVEPENDMILRTKNRFLNEGAEGPTIVSGMGQHLPFRNEVFDSVVCVNTFYNQTCMHEIVNILKDMARVCKRGGCIIFDVRNSFNPIVFLAYKFASLYDPSSMVIPINTYSIFAIQRVLRGLGFTAIKKTPVFFPFTMLAPAMVIQARKGN